MEILNNNIYWCDLPKYSNTILYKRRPCIVISNDIQNKGGKTVNVIPITSNLKRVDLPCHVMVDTGYDSCGMAKAEQILTINKENVKWHIKALDRKEVKDVRCALLTQIGII